MFPTFRGSGVQIIAKAAGNEFPAAFYNVFESVITDAKLLDLLDESDLAALDLVQVDATLGDVTVCTELDVL